MKNPNWDIADLVKASTTIPGTNERKTQHDEIGHAKSGFEGSLAGKATVYATDLPFNDQARARFLFVNKFS